MANNIATDRKTLLESRFAIIAGRPVDITVRGERSFTFSFDAIDADATRGIVGFFEGQPVALEVNEDAECGTFIYAEVSL